MGRGHGHGEINIKKGLPHGPTRLAPTWSEEPPHWHQTVSQTQLGLINKNSLESYFFIGTCVCDCIRHLMDSSPVEKRNPDYL